MNVSVFLKVFHYSLRVKYPLKGLGSLFYSSAEKNDNSGNKNFTFQ
jgi:hypothetical protein